MQITSEPATIAISINHNNYTNSLIDATGRFAISILSEVSDSALIGRFGFKSGKDTDKFADIDYKVVDGMPVLTGICGYIVCKVVNKMETATHTVFLGEVTDAEISDGGDAMTYAYYHKVIRGQSPPNAPTYIPPTVLADEKSPSNAIYICKVCNYERESEPEADYKCPICGVGKEKFEPKQ